MLSLALRLASCQCFSVIIEKNKIPVDISLACITRTTPNSKNKLQNYWKKTENKTEIYAYIYAA